MGRLRVSCRRKMHLPKMSCFSKQKAAMLRDVPRRPSKPQTDLMCSHSCSFPNGSWCVVTRAHSQSLLSLLSAQSCTKFLSRISVSDTDAFVLLHIVTRTQTSWCKRLHPQLQTDPLVKELRSKQPSSCVHGLLNRASGHHLCLLKDGVGTRKELRDLTFCVLCVFGWLLPMT